MLLMFVVGLKKSNSTPAVVESSGMVSLEMMKIGSRAKKQLKNNDDKSRDINNTAKSYNPHTLQSTDVKPSLLGDDSSEQAFTNNRPISTLCIGQLSCQTKFPDFGNNSTSVSSQTIIPSFSQKSDCATGFDISCSLPSFPFERHKIVFDKCRPTSNFELATQCHKDPLSW